VKFGDKKDRFANFDLICVKFEIEGIPGKCREKVIFVFRGSPNTQKWF